jgi:hypothetical protein
LGCRKARDFIAKPEKLVNFFDAIFFFFSFFPVEQREQQTKMSLNPSASEWKPNFGAKSFVPSFAGKEMKKIKNKRK